jgi:hypothetical protein
MISKADIFDIATSVGITLTDVEIDWVLLSYEDAQRQDPSGTWDLVVEDLIQQAVEFRKDPMKDHREMYGEDASTDDCFFDYENNHPFPFHSDGDGDDDTLLNFMG